MPEPQDPREGQEPQEPAVRQMHISSHVRSKDGKDGTRSKQASICSCSTAPSVPCFPGKLFQGISGMTGSHAPARLKLIANLKADTCATTQTGCKQTAGSADSTAFTRRTSILICTPDIPYVYKEGTWDTLEYGPYVLYVPVQKT